MSTQHALKANAKLDSMGGYVAGDFLDLKYRIVVKDLETHDRIALEFRPKKKVQLMYLLPGKYAIVDVSADSVGLFNRTSYTMKLPTSLMKLLVIEPGKAVYLGKFEHEKSKSILSSLTRDGGTISISTDIDDVHNNLNDTYNIQNPIEVVPF